MLGLRMLRSPITWPLSVKVPFLVIALMIAVSGAISDRVLTRLSEMQDQHLRDLTNAYLEGIAASIILPVQRQDVWEVFDVLDRAKNRYPGLNVEWTIVAGRGDRVLASDNPVTFRSLDPLPEEILDQFLSGGNLAFLPNNGQALAVKPLIYQSQEIGRLYAQIDVSSLLAERADVLRALLITNAVITVVLATLGYFAVRRMVMPVQTLTDYLNRGVEGSVEQIPDHVITRQSTELQRLFLRYNAMAGAVSERERLASKLAEEERLASLGRLAAGLAHEINNPLGGMFNALDALKKYGSREEVRQTSARLLEKGLTGIRDLVRSTLGTYRRERRPRLLSSQELDDLKLLLKPHLKQKGLRLVWKNELTGSLDLSALQVRDAILNLLLNACNATPAGGTVTFHAGAEAEDVVFVISDEGVGMTGSLIQYIEGDGSDEAHFADHAGLGLWMVKRHCRDLDGSLHVLKLGNQGTTIEFRVPRRAGALAHAA